MFSKKSMIILGCISLTALLSACGERSEETVMDVEGKGDDNQLACD